jgi:hypothetical protein
MREGRFVSALLREADDRVGADALERADRTFSRSGLAVVPRLERLRVQLDHAVGLDADRTTVRQLHRVGAVLEGFDVAAKERALDVVDGERLGDLRLAGVVSRGGSGGGRGRAAF